MQYRICKGLDSPDMIAAAGHAEPLDQEFAAMVGSLDWYTACHSAQRTTQEQHMQSLGLAAGQGTSGASSMPALSMAERFRCVLRFKQIEFTK